MIDLKLEALLLHNSQFGAREDFLKRMKERWADDDGRFREKFKLVELQFYKIGDGSPCPALPPLRRSPGSP